ncbi:hypothetical protein BDZ94DRAFT_1264300 [Collybia nuda]|uniref:DUF6533 domain-containing protein n=1 Tax=Collybia nuda TaxID=64659 RepID=A0A9P6CHT8_9AGAR|nr:hypothetical protein BDZ94DRAFT_1264300 [Collybia nuda]
MADLAVVMAFVKDVQYVRICQLASMVVVLYDHAIKFPEEVDLIWRRKWSTPSILYILIRYLTATLLVLSSVVFFTPSTPQRVSHRLVFVKFQAWSTTFLFFFMQAILQIRLCAMYNNSRKVKICLSVAFSTQVIVLSTLLIIGHVPLGAVAEPFPGIYMCTAMNMPKWYPAWWAPVVLLDLGFFWLALRVGIRNLKEMRSLSGGDTRISMLRRIMLRDSILYYLVILSINVVNAFVWMGLKGITYEIPQGFSVAAVSILGCRLVLNLRYAYHYPISDNTQLHQSDMDNILPIQSLPDFTSVSTP